MAEPVLSDFRSVPLPGRVDAAITSPPFAEVGSVLDHELDASSGSLVGSLKISRLSRAAASRSSRSRRSTPISTSPPRWQPCFAPVAALVMHLGQTAKVDMAAEIAPLLEPHFQVQHVGRECVPDMESHGLADKGATIAHWYLFAERR
ncbi:MAG: hypothetical protein U5K30_05775 [Acidimicrobiales bacterium]|nr:hypothetical protein [Acidimicrobiales bacterium]